MLHRSSKKHTGFTIIELVVIITVVGILASITVSYYGGWRERTAKTELKSDLQNFAAAMKSSRNFNNAYPASYPDSFRPSKNVVLQRAAADSKEYCVNAYHVKYPGLVFSFDSKTGQLREMGCSGPLIGSPIGGSVPTAPRNTNLVAGFDQWQTSGGVSYDAGSKELRFNGAGSATSPLVKVDSPTTSKLTVESYSTTASPSCTPDSCTHFSSYYFGSDGTTAVQNSSGYTANGNAQTTPLNSWVQKSWTTAAGPNVIYVQFIIRSSPTSYTSDNRIRNPTIEAL